MPYQEIDDVYEPFEGHHVAKMFDDDDCDHGPCTGYEIKELDLTVYVYKNDPTRISFHVGD